MTLENRLQSLAARVTSALDFDQMVIEACAPYAMSMHQGLDADSFVLTQDGTHLFVKLYHDELPGSPDPALAFAAQAAASEIGLAPQVVAFFEDLRAAVFQHAPQGWRVAMSADLTDPALRTRVVTTLRRLHALPNAPKASVWQPLTAIVEAVEKLQKSGGVAARLVLPEDGEWLLGIAAEMQVAAATETEAFLHGEILASNLLTDGAGGVMLVDFDRAAGGDPLWDLAGLALAAHLEDAELTTLLSHYDQSFGAPELLRLQQLMVLQDISAGLWGRAAHFITPRKSIEFFKYGETRLARARARLAQLGLRHGAKS